LFILFAYRVTEQTQDNFINVYNMCYIFFWKRQQQDPSRTCTQQEGHTQISEIFVSHSATRTVIICTGIYQYSKRDAATKKQNVNVNLLLCKQENLIKNYYAFL